MKKIFFLSVLLGLYIFSSGQELYVYSEPASNMPANTISAKVTGMRTSSYTQDMLRIMPELMFGFNKNLMVHVTTSFSNMDNNRRLGWESVYLYGKYRFLSLDDVHKHFRMAAFAQGGYSNGPGHHKEINLMGDRSGVQGGLIATQLVNKFAASATVSYTRAFKPEELHAGMPYTKEALNYSLSTGLLVLPREYKSYDQLNVNVYAELLGQKIPNDPFSYLDLGMAVQFIFKSNTKLNIGRRIALIKRTEDRLMAPGYQISVEHTFFNALKRKRE